MAQIAKTSTVRLGTGYLMPVIGLGVYQNYTTRDSVLEAMRAGYRWAAILTFGGMFAYALGFSACHCRTHAFLYWLSHVDSAQAYKNEAHVGQGLRDAGVDRSEVFITTKIISKYHGFESTLKGVDESLARFQFNYIDLFLIHDPLSGTERRLTTYKALQEAKKVGKIRSVGVSNYGIKHLEEIKDAGYEMPAVNQIELHPFCQQRPIVAYCKEKDIVVQAYSPLVRGRMDHSTFLELAHKHQRDPAQVLIRWSLQKGYVPLPKSANLERIKSNLNVFDFELDAADMVKLDSLDRGKEGAVTWNPVDAA